MPTVRGLKIDPATGDLAAHVDHRLPLVSDTEAIAQSLRTRLSLFLGECFWAEDQGTPWFQEILGKQPSLQGVREAFRQVIVDTPGVSDVLTLTLEPTVTPRNYKLTFTVATDLGELTVTTVAGA